MANKIIVPLDVSDPVVLRRLLVEIVEYIAKPEPLVLDASSTYNIDDINTIVSKINEIIDKN